MRELDRWTETTVINPLEGAIMDADQKGYEETVERIQRAVRQKVLESYRNGQKARDYNLAGEGRRVMLRRKLAGLGLILAATAAVAVLGLLTRPR